MAGKKRIKLAERIAPRPRRGRPRKTADVPAPASEMDDQVDLRARLRRDIVNCDLAPGQRMKFEELRARYDSGIGSLREALMQLVADGLVVAESNRGFCVAPVSIPDLEDITELRVDIEKKALTQSIQHGNDAWEAGIVAAFHMIVKMTPDVSQRSREVWEERHARFHTSLVNACPSPWLLRFRQILFVQSQRYRALSLLQSQRPGRVDAHRKIMDAVLARDVAAATAEMEQHIRQTTENVCVWLTAHGGGVSTTEFTQDRESRRASNSSITSG
jgi:DNA-binding GntR family transcriptional regulator